MRKMVMLSRLLVQFVNLGYLCIILILFFSFKLTGQDTQNILETTLELEESSISILDLVDVLNKKYDIILSYNSSNIDDHLKKDLKKTNLNLDLALNLLLKGYAFSVEIDDSRINIIFPKTKTLNKNIFGYITDYDTNEPLSGVFIFDKKTGISSYTNNYGYYSLNTNLNDNHIVVSYLGYRSAEINDVTKPMNNIFLKNVNKFDPIVILEDIGSDINIHSGAKILDVSERHFNRHVSFNNDVIKLLNSEPITQSGNEGQGSYIANGGSPDQNLVLLDGVMLYNYSHSLGLNSIFITETLHAAEILSSGIPARYGDRLSSVLNLKTKDGDKGELQGVFKIGISDLTLQLDGPIITDKTTFNIGLRQSIFDLYLPEIINKFTDYGNSSIDYHDIMAKVTHRFGPTKSLQFLYYTGSDFFKLSKSTIIGNETNYFSSDNSDALNWGSDIYSVRFNNTFNDRAHLSTRLSYSDYQQKSRSNFRFDNLLSVDTCHTEIFNLYANSNIKDVNFSMDIDYYFTERNKLRIGLGWNRQEINPSLIQNTVIYNGGTPTINENPSFVSSTQYLYLEDTYQLNKRILFYGGLRLTSYINDEKFVNFQPRLKLIYNYNKDFSTHFSYDHTYQYIHKLVNSGLGLPLELWVPSIHNLKPQDSHQFKWTTELNLASKFRFFTGAFYKKMDNLIEYTNPVNIYFIDLNTQNDPILTDPDDWQEHVFQGTGESWGLELGLRYESELVAGWFNYTYARTFLTFDEVNDGKRFPSVYDRPHDLNIGLNYQLSDHFILAAQYTYASGKTFSLPLEGFNDILGITQITNTSRNNYRFSAFQRLNITAEYQKQLEVADMTIRFGLSNVTNRLNPYYVYLYTDPIENSYSLRQVSLFPILPVLELTFKI